MSNGIEMKEDQFDELSLESKLTVLFTKAVQNGHLLEGIHKVCINREVSCSKKFDTLNQKVKTKAVIEKTIAAVFGSASGFLGGIFGGKL